MPPPGYEPFLRAISENPADDAPRLVYADWLDENGQPERAEFIRTQIEHWHNGEPATGLRIYALQEEFRAKWLAELPKIPGVEWDVEFYRGFIRDVAFDQPTRFLRHASTVAAVVPLTHVTIRRCSDKILHRILDVPEVARLDSLVFHNFRASQSRGLWTTIAASPALANLREFQVWFDHMDQLNWDPVAEFEAEWRWVVNECPHMRRLEVFAPGTGELFRDVASLRRLGWMVRSADPQPPAPSGRGPWQALRRMFGMGG